MPERGHAHEAAAPVPTRIGPKKLETLTAQTFRHLAICEREAKRALFVSLLDEDHGNRALVARFWRCDPKVVYRVAKGDWSLTPAKIDALPPSMRARFVARFGDPLQLRLPGI